MKEPIKRYLTKYPSDVTDAEWEFCAPYLSLMREDAPQRTHCPRAVFNALRYVVKTGCPWRYLPSDFPPHFTVHQQAQRWVKAGVFETMANDLRKLVRLLAGRHLEPTAAIFDGRTIQSVPESGKRAGYDGYKRKKGSKTHIAVDVLGNLLAVMVTPANEQERDQAGELSRQVQEATGQNVKIAFVDQGYTGETPAQEAAAHGIDLCVVKLAEAKRGFVLLPRRWVVERTFGWMNRFRRLARDYERLSNNLASYHWIAAITLALHILLPKSA